MAATAQCGAGPGHVVGGHALGHMAIVTTDAARNGRHAGQQAVIEHRNWQKGDGGVARTARDITDGNMRGRHPLDPHAIVAIGA